MKDRPQVSDEEIQSMMDFDKLLQRHNTLRKTRRTAGIIGALALVALTSAWLLLKPAKEQQPVLVEKTISAPEEIKPVQQTPTEQKEESEPTRVQPLKPVEVKKKPVNESTTPADAADVFTEAEPVNGYDHLYSYFEKELTYPSYPNETNDGVVEATFVIDRDGKPAQIKIQNSLGPAFDQEIIRVINAMPAWKPATQNGKAIPAKISQSFTFKSKRP